MAKLQGLIDNMELHVAMDDHVVWRMGFGAITMTVHRRVGA